MTALGDDVVGFMVNGIRVVCERFRGRSAGSAAEHRCQRYFMRLCGKWADSVEIEGFTLHPRAFWGWLRVAVIMVIAGVLLFWISWLVNSPVMPALAAFCALFTMLMFIFEFVFYRCFIDFTFPAAGSYNLIARRSPKGEVRRRIIFGGHADAAYELTYSFRGRSRLMLPLLGSAVLMALFVLGSNSVLLIRSLDLGGIVLTGPWLAVGLAQLAAVPLVIAIYSFVNWKVVVDGANDNLSGCYVAMGVLKHLSDRGIRFDNTEVCCLITGAEEAGLRGSQAYARRHRKALSQVETVFIALDTLREAGQLQVYTLGRTGTQPNCPRAAWLLAQAGHQCGITLQPAKLYPGATDAEAFSRYHLSACGLCGINHIPQPYYHTRMDTWDNIDADCLRQALCICLEAVDLFDADGLPKVPERNINKPGSTIRQE